MKCDDTRTTSGDYDGMSELNHSYLLDQQHELTARRANEIIMGYIALSLQHEAPSGFDANDEEPEGKNA